MGIGKFRGPGGDVRYSWPLYRGTNPSFSFTLAYSSTLPTLSSNTRVSIATSPNHVRSSRQGRWVASSVTKEDITELRVARYLTAEIHHRLPAEGQVISTPRSGERVVFVSHFLRSLGFALNPFVRGLMFYYGLDFHDLARTLFFSS